MTECCPRHCAKCLYECKPGDHHAGQCQADHVLWHTSCPMCRTEAAMARAVACERPHWEAAARRDEAERIAKALDAKGDRFMSLAPGGKGPSAKIANGLWIGAQIARGEA